jgi:hypothetical protein
MQNSFGDVKLSIFPIIILNWFMRWLLASFLYASHIVIALPNIFLLLKTIARSTENCLYEQERATTISIEQSRKKSKEFTSKLKHKD